MSGIRHRSGGGRHLGLPRRASCTTIPIAPTTTAIADVPAGLAGTTFALYGRGGRCCLPLRDALRGGGLRCLPGRGFAVVSGPPITQIKFPVSPSPLLAWLVDSSVPVYTTAGAQPYMSLLPSTGVGTAHGHTGAFPPRAPCTVASMALCSTEATYRPRRHQLRHTRHRQPRHTGTFQGVPLMLLPLSRPRRSSTSLSSRRTMAPSTH